MVDIGPDITKHDVLFAWRKLYALLLRYLRVGSGPWK
jgi:hypothetical protein